MTLKKILGGVITNEDAQDALQPRQYVLARE